MQLRMSSSICSYLLVAYNHMPVNLYGCHGMSPFVLYAWASRCSYYVGIASVERKQKRSTPGPACRWLEHMCGMFRTHTAESQKLRYKLMRRFRPEDTFFLVCRAGPEVSCPGHGNFGNRIQKTPLQRWTC